MENLTHEVAFMTFHEDLVESGITFNVFRKGAVDVCQIMAVILWWGMALISIQQVEKFLPIPSLALCHCIGGRGGG